MAEKEDRINKLCDIFGVLGKKLDYPKEYNVKRNILVSDYAGDVVIDSLFATPEDLERYQVSSEHQAAITNASSIKKTKTIVDYIL